MCKLSVVCCARYMLSAHKKQLTPDTLHISFIILKSESGVGPDAVAQARFNILPFCLVLREFSTRLSHHDFLN